MENAIKQKISPFMTFTRSEWAALRADTPMTLSEDEVEFLRGQNERFDLDDVIKIYLPLSRLLSLYVHAAQELFDATETFLGADDGKVPYVIGIGGSVAVGKSTTSRILKALLSRWPNTPKVDMVTTDGFLRPNAALLEQGLMERKGFPESFDLPALLEFLGRIKAGDRNVEAPVYSHFAYDVLPDQRIVVDRPDILILEGLNVLQTGQAPRGGMDIPFVSDFFDFSIYIDAETPVIERWYVDRFMRLRQTAFRDPAAYFHRYANLSDQQARETALDIWTRINRPNLEDNILPTRQRADLILRKSEDHRIERVWLRKL
ncbi:MAG: type I pantothenate kinase [Rhodobiaceae bacterium]|nr:type I pantothenate kinase [Rhodobiaceae bacterium]MCC0055423.1 type I pantothenate kinase [Rhodobiaceae bacterium]